MERHSFGEKVRLAAVESETGCSKSTVNRVEVVRPDGTSVSRDWDRGIRQVTVDQAGIWTWRMYIREGNATRITTGRFEVLADRDEMQTSNGVKGLITRILGHR